MTNQLRTEANSGSIDDLAHVSTTEQLADVLTKRGCNPKFAVEAVETGRLINCDKNIPVREMMKDTQGLLHNVALQKFELSSSNGGQIFLWSCSR